MKNLAIIAVFFLGSLYGVSALVTCNTSNCNATNPCSYVYPNQITSMNCFQAQRAFQILAKIPPYKVNNTAQFKDVNMTAYTGLTQWPFLFYQSCTQYGQSFNVTVNSNKNCYAYMETVENYTAIKNRNLSVHDMYELIAFTALSFDITAVSARGGSANLAEKDFHSWACNSTTLASAWSSNSTTWTNTTSVNPFPFYTTSNGTVYNVNYDQITPRSAWLYQFSQFYSDNNGYTFAAMNGNVLDECVPANWELY